ncbi:MAG: bifunctional UDP-N-acetylmuramoyl-tripeptide:D-alanyl-D-alanine ligase/alanine racemase [Sphingobacteriales bacterium 50-39]|nr:bifunctional UDP-N-acetylmuramoyl-tripeptide:D-alanyl-D-alanine ligase/alanine racemase [Sphingobacteriales bacterium]OJW58131.1 MAG: bifunctional UDP-N-acetylmuramoyl-tripeptide:D-alanyl-D-alanine ligase/alanine racemase [Sphingobacteriales bacterium 50-39]
MKYAIRHIAGIVGGSFLQFRGDDTVEHLLLDSRRLIFPDTSLFFSLKGPRRDGGLFIEELYRRGVRNFIVGETISIDLPGANIILVDDTLAALQRLTAFHRRAFSIPVIGITGSNGKTTVKEWLNQLLEDSYQVVRSPKSYNSQIGVPLSVWQLNESHELAIFEAGISRGAEMGKLQRIIQPTIGIFTNIGEAHSEGFLNRAEKAAEKLQLFAEAEVLIYNSDQTDVVTAVDEWLVRIGGGPNLFAWGRGGNGAVRVDAVEKNGGATRVHVTYLGQKMSFDAPFTDDASIENVMHCICVLLYLGQQGEQINQRLQQLTRIAMRLELKGGINHCSIINDSYSADLSSLSLALDFLSQQRQHPRRTVILSDFLESGQDEGSLYTTIARMLSQKKIDRMVGVGPRISLHAALIAKWFTAPSVFYPSVEEFKNALFQLHFRDETILLKGARVFEFEDIDRLLSEQIHQTVLEINLDALTNNLGQYRGRLEPATKLMAMVKAFSYGSGSFEIANRLQRDGVDYLGVAYADEGVVLRKGGIHMPIMVMNTENSSFDLLVQYNLEPVIYSFSLLRDFDKWLRKEGVMNFPVHIELETGMNRLGFSTEPSQELDALIRALKSANFKIQSVFSHLAASEEAQQDDYTHRQGGIYRAAVARIQEALPYPFLRHIANTAAIVRHPDLRLDMVRLGIGLYGVDSADSHQLDLREVSTLKSTIAQIKYLKEGETVGYNRRGIAGQDTVIATVRIGYADGYPRRLGNGVGKMWVKGRLAPVIGSVCMDMTMIDISGIVDVQEGDEVVVFGKELPVNQLAHWAQTIPYEILTGVSQRVRRVYFEE